MILESIEVAFGVLACIGLLFALVALIDALRVRRYQRRHGINGLQARYGRERIRQETLFLIIQGAMALAASSALVQNVEPGPQPGWANTLVLALCIAEILLVIAAILRQVTRSRMLRALARAEERQKHGDRP